MPIILKMKRKNPKIVFQKKFTYRHNGLCSSIRKHDGHKLAASEIPLCNRYFRLELSKRDCILFIYLVVTIINLPT